MFTVRTPEKVFQILKAEFPSRMERETVPLSLCCGRTLAQDLAADEWIPGFHRSTVDGYAVSSGDTFGCSDAIPALLRLAGHVSMGQEADFVLSREECASVPTGGAVPDGADAVVMVEYTEDYGDGTIGILKPVPPGGNLVHRGDDTSPGKTVLHSGRKLTVSDIGALAAMGKTEIPVCRKPVIGIISTGDELVSIEARPAGGQVRDVNSSVLDAMCRDFGAETVLYGIVPDEAGLLASTVRQAIGECDIVLISGGSSVGVRDATLDVIESCGQVLFHGIAMKPGKPTILGKASGKPVFGLPGHPVAAFFVSWIFVRFLIARLSGRSIQEKTIPATLTEAISTNHGRAEYLGVRLHRNPDGAHPVPGRPVFLAEPIRTKSGLISSLAGSDGYICIPRDCEGLSAGETVSVICYTTE